MTILQMNGSFALFQAWANCAPDADRARPGAQSVRDKPYFLGTYILPYEKEKITLDLQVFS